MRTAKKTKTLAFVGIAASVALLLSYIEFLTPPVFAAVPGIKLGLPNIIILYVLYAIGPKHAAFVSFSRLCISTLLFGNVMMLAYSAAGAALSLAVMILLKKTGRFSSVGVSVAGGVSHNLGQVLVAMLLLDTPEILYYMIVLTVTGTLSGIFIGLCGGLLVSRIPPSKILLKN